MNRSASSRRENVSRPNGWLGIERTSTEYAISGGLLGSRARRITATHDGASGLATAGIPLPPFRFPLLRSRRPDASGTTPIRDTYVLAAGSGFSHSCANDDGGTIKAPIGGERNDNDARDT